MVPVNANPRQFWGPSVPLFYSLNSAGRIWESTTVYPLDYPGLGFLGKIFLLPRSAMPKGSSSWGMPFDSKYRFNQVEKLAERQPVLRTANLISSLQNILTLLFTGQVADLVTKRKCDCFDFSICKMVAARYLVTKRSSQWMV